MLMLANSCDFVSRGLIVCGFLTNDGGLGDTLYHVEKGGSKCS